MYKVRAIEINGNEKVTVQQLLEFCKNKKPELFFLPEGNEINANETFFIKKIREGSRVYQPVLNNSGSISKVLSHRTEQAEKHYWSGMKVSEKDTFSKSYIIALST